MNPSMSLLIGYKPDYQVCESSTMRSRGHKGPSRAGQNFVLDKSHEFTYENTSFDYEFSLQPCDGYPESFESNEVL